LAEEKALNIMFSVWFCNFNVQQKASADYL